MVKVVSLFLIVMMVLAMFGKLRLPKIPTLKRRSHIENAKKCTTCGTYKIGDQPCKCANK
ncbi:thymidine kinase [Amylibacter sp. SFDW26]|nr:thymidine kinase [Amylibacter sp. SFDW26]KAB7613979.1 thymidine kinase [Amylibacter sp. SFDW26]